jgi:DNA-binding MarR family transcriptional regulator
MSFVKKDAEEIYRDRTIFLISRIREKANRFILQELKKHNLAGIVPSHGDILVALYLHHPLTMKNLAEMIDRDKSTVTTLVDKLIRLGYVEKKTHPEDNRMTLVFLTGKGRGLKPAFLGISEALQAKVYKSLTGKERRTLVDLLRRISDNW